MSRINLEESTIPQGFTSLLDAKNFSWEAADTADFIKVLFLSIADYLKNRKGENKIVGISIKDTNGNFVMGAKVTHDKPLDSEEDPTGNWGLVFTFDKSDMDECTETTDHSDAAFQTTFMEDAYNEQGMRFDNYSICYGIIIDAVNCIKEYLDQNVKENEELTVVLDDYFEATASVEDGVKVFGITPIGQVKTIIKKPKEA